MTARDARDVLDFALPIDIHPLSFAAVGLMYTERSAWKGSTQLNTIVEDSRTGRSPEVRSASREAW